MYKVKTLDIKAEKTRVKRARDMVKTWAANQIATAQSRGFYGKMTFLFENGAVKRMIKEESLKPDIDDSFHE
jgi:hypothetical protein